jgi:hypothetical protein
MIVTLNRPLSCDHIVALFYDGYISSSEAHRLLALSEDDAATKAQADADIGAYYGP